MQRARERAKAKSDKFKGLPIKALKNASDKTLTKWEQIIDAELDKREKAG